MRLAGDDFIGKIKTNTEEMIKEISKRIDIKSQIRFPTNLQSLFKTLDFATSDGVYNISLSNRGDGVKTRHIPAILKFISDQLNINKVQGSPSVSMIWGYEEPENNLEMLIAYNLAAQFVDYSDEIQLLLTTHSPGFYSLKSKHKEIVNLFKVTKPKESAADIVKLDSQDNLDTDMGIMPIISPYIEQKVKEVEELKSNILVYKKELESINSNVIYVEGEDEVRVFTKIIADLNLSSKISVKCKGMGCSGVKNHVMAWSWVAGISTFKAVGVFDNDISGNSELKKLKDEVQYKISEGSQKAKGLTYKAPQHLLNIKRILNMFPIELEEMYPIDVWTYAQNKKMLIERDVFELSSFVTLDSKSQTISAKINSLGFNDNEKLYILNKIPDQHKEKLSKFTINDLVSLSKEERMGPLIDFFEKNIRHFLVS